MCPLIFLSSTVFYDHGPDISRIIYDHGTVKLKVRNVNSHLQWCKLFEIKRTLDLYNLNNLQIH